MSELRWTRGQLVRRAASAGLGLVLFDPLGGRLFGEGAAFGSAAAALPDVRHFVSRPDLRPPKLTVLRAGKTGAGDLFLAPSSGPGQRGVLILDNGGDVVWFHPTTPNTAMNFRTATYQGKPVLTWWEGKADDGLGPGDARDPRRSYRDVARFPAGGGRQSDLHEFLITPQNTALVTSYEMRPILSRVGGPVTATVIGGVVQEIELPAGACSSSGAASTTWRSRSPSATSAQSLDYFHVNSIDLTADGDLLVSARNTWAVYKIEPEERRGSVAARRQAQRLRDGQGHGLRVAARRAPSRQRPDHHLRRRRRAHSRTAVAGAAHPARTERRRATLVRKYAHRPGRLDPTSWATRRRSATATSWSGGAASRTSPSSTKTARSLRGEVAPRRPELPRVPFALGRATDAPGRRSSTARRATAASSSSAGTAPLKSPLGSCSQARPPRRSSLGRRFRSAGSRRRLPQPPGLRYAAVVALDRHGAQLSRSKTVRI